MNSYDYLKPYHKDILNEIGSIYGGNSATSLFSLLSEVVTLNVCSASLHGYKHLSNSIAEDKKLMISHLGNDINGLLCLRITQPIADTLAKIMSDDYLVDFNKYGNLGDSANVELASILFGTILTGLTSLLPSPKARITYTVPEIIHNNDDLRRHKVDLWKNSSHVFTHVILTSYSFNGSIFFFMDYLSFDFFLKGFSHSDNSSLRVLERY